MDFEQLEKTFNDLRDEKAKVLGEKAELLKEPTELAKKRDEYLKNHVSAAAAQEHRRSDQEEPGRV